MEEIFLDAQFRQETGRGKVNDLRDAGFIPAVIYGEGAKSQAIKISGHQLIQTKVLYHKRDTISSRARQYSACGF
ncbi:MAG: hypothetical protein NT033_05875 [Candidatus Omnitrophica bacterium]|nr:hypothetical protein [Candidatus Omnitrophota bacterium]